MAKTISKKISVKDSAANHSGNTPPGDKTFWVEPLICFYATEDGHETEKGEEAEVLVITTKASRQLKQKGEESEILVVTNKSSRQPRNTYINPWSRGIRIWLIKHLKCLVQDGR